MDDTPVLITNLRRLRSLEQELAVHERMITAESDALLQAKVEANETRSLAKEKEEERYSLGQREKLLEASINEVDAKIAKLDDQRQSSTSSQMMEAAERQIATLKIERDQLETEGLEVLDRLEKLDGQIKSLEVRTEDATRRRGELKEKVAVVKAEQQPLIEALKEEQKTLLDTLEPEIVNRYVDLMKQRGDSIVEVADGCCLGCGEQIAENVVTVMKGGKAVMTCQGCHRILIPQISP